MCLFIDCYFLFEVDCCVLVYILKICHLKIVNGAVNARKWRAKWRNGLLFQFNRGAKAAEAARNIFTVYGDNAIGENTVGKWFSRFKEAVLTLDTSRSCRPSEFDEDRSNTLIHNDPRQCTRELANVMNCDHFIIVRHLHSMGMA